MSKERDGCQSFTLALLVPSAITDKQGLPSGAIRTVGATRARVGVSRVFFNRCLTGLGGAGNGGFRLKR